MTKRKNSEVEMIGAVKQMESGRSAAEMGPGAGVWKHTVYAWKTKYGGRRSNEFKTAMREWTTWEQKPRTL